MKRRVVITDVGIVTPNAASFEAFGKALNAGKSGLSEIDCFDAASLPVRIAGQVNRIDITGLTRKYPALRTTDDRKVFIGLTAFLQLRDQFSNSFTPLDLGTSLEQFAIDKAFERSPGHFDLDAYMAAKRPETTYLETPLDFLGNIIKATFSIGGPNYLNCSACTASTQAIGHAFHMIRDGRYDRVIAGGFDSMLHPLGIGGFSRLGALCTDNDLKASAIRPFDIRRDGTVLGEGAAMLALESLDHALKENSPILGEILGYASTFDAFKISEPDRSGQGIAAAMRGALNDAGITPEAIDYINAHGTGTIANDRAETMAIKDVFGKKAYRIPVSSTKSMIGHLIGASGAVEIAAVLAMFRNDFIAPTINLEKKDPECDLDYVPLKARKYKINVSIKNSMGFGGQNAVVVLKRYVPHPRE